MPPDRRTQSGVAERATSATSDVARLDRTGLDLHTGDRPPERTTRAPAHRELGQLAEVEDLAGGIRVGRDEGSVDV
jgi:hypothetical protein